MVVANAKGRWPILLGVAAAIILILGTLHETKHKLPEATRKFWPFHDSAQSSTPQGDPPADDFSQAQPDAQAQGWPQGETAAEVQTGPPLAHEKQLSFYEIGLKHGTDKVTAHSYQDMYEKYLPALRHKRIKMLEIGLGCDMAYGPGASYKLWLEYFPNIDLYFLEYDAACAAEWAHKTEGATIITGDQADGALLDRIVLEHGNDFDIIVDDGGHTMVQQQTSIEHLWKAIKPGGIYFCEDLQTSYWDRFGGGNAAVAAGQTTTMQYIYKLMEDLTWGDRRIEFPEVEQMVHIDCSREVCGFFKRALPTINL